MRSIPSWCFLALFLCGPAAAQTNPRALESDLARDFLALFSLPNFLFHVTTAYALLRSKGVPLGKMDFLSGAQLASA